MKRRIGILTSGGDCPGLNAAIRGVARAAYEMFDAEIVGIHDGYAGLIAGDVTEMSRSQFSGILTLGGTILGTRRTPFRDMKKIGEDNVDKVEAMKKTYCLEDLDCANCALKMETGIKKLDGVKDCSVSFMTQKMTVEAEDGTDLDELMKRIAKLCRKVEPDMRIKL